MAEVTEQQSPKFPSVSQESWRAAVESGLRGKRIEDKLTTTTSDGIVIQPLYADDADARLLPWSSGSWRPHELLNGTDAGALQDQMRRAAAFGVQGFRVGNVAGEIEAKLVSIAKELGVGLHWTASVSSDVALSRLGHGIAGGQSLARGALSKEVVQAAGPTDLLFAASSSGEQSRGAGVALQVAVCLARGVAWLREGAEHGASASDVAARLEFQLGLGTDLFLEVAKLRALRLCWTKLLQSCEASAPCRMHVESSQRAWTVRDPWVNGLRGTTIAIAAALGGAESVLVLPFDAMLGNSDEDAMRLARNTHAILAQESHLNEVQDPAAGSGYIESLTADIAQGAWVLFQEIERLGDDALEFIEQEMQLSAEAESAAIATRQSGLIGVSEFPNLEEDLPRRSGTSFANTWTLAAPFEDLRARSDRHLDQHGARPTAFLCNFGTQLDFRARAGFSTNLLAAGGIAVSDNDGFQTVQSALDAYGASELPIAVINSTDDLYAEHVPALAAGLKELGATVVLAGKPRDRESEWTGAGIHAYIHLGCDALAVLRDLQTRAGVSA